MTQPQGEEMIQTDYYGLVPPRVYRGLINGNVPQALFDELVEYFGRNDWKHLLGYVRSKGRGLNYGEVFRDRPAKAAFTRPAEATESTRREPTWGPWQLSLTEPTLVCNLDGRPGVYEIDLMTCTRSAQVLDWIVQVSTKTWTTTEVLAYLVLALDGILMLQPMMCGSGEDHVLDEKTIRELIGATRQLAGR